MPKMTVPAINLAFDIDDSQINGHAINQFKLITHRYNNALIELQRMQIENSRLSAELALVDNSGIEEQRRINAGLVAKIGALDKEIEALRERRGCVDWLAWS